MTTTSKLALSLSALPARDRLLLRGLMGLAVAALALGLMLGTVTALARGGFLPLDGEAGYRAMTLHGVNAFFYWLYAAQGALLLAFAVPHGGGGLRLRGLAWAGLALLAAGFAASLLGSATGAPLLYDGHPALAEDKGPAALFYAGYLLLAAGLAALACSAIATVLAGRQAAWPATAFAVFAWAGFLMVSSIAATHAFLPAFLWAVEAGAFPHGHATDWHILFHNLHYLPLMAMVMVWYVLMEEVVGVKSIFGARFSKIVFSAYLVFVPPTSLYHMFLEPDLAEGVRVVGSLLSLFVSVPTLTAFLIICATLEAHARSQGAVGLFGWLKRLPWRNPSVKAAAVAAINMGFGIVFAFVLIQGELAPLLSDSFFVPGYFHFFTVGAVSLSLIAGISAVAPALTGGGLWRPDLLARLPMPLTVSLAVFGAAGVAAGYLGVPRRAFDVAAANGAPPLWEVLMAAVGVGGLGMGAVLGVYAWGLAATLLGRGAPVAAPVPWPPLAGAPGKAWTGPLAVGLIVLAMYAFTALAFELALALPVDAVGGGGHAH